MTPDDVKLLRKLAARNLDPEVMIELGRKGREGYDLLLGQVKGGTLEKCQMGNAMALLVELRFHGDQDELFSILLEITGDRRAEVRAEATRLVMVLTIIAEHRKDDAIKNANRAYVAPFLRGALAHGFRNRGLESRVRDFLSEGSLHVLTQG